MSCLVLLILISTSYKQVAEVVTQWTILPQINWNIQRQPNKHRLIQSRITSMTIDKYMKVSEENSVYEVHWENYVYEVHWETCDVFLNFWFTVNHHEVKKQYLKINISDFALRCLHHLTNRPQCFTAFCTFDISGEVQYPCLHLNSEWNSSRTLAL